MWAIIYQAKLSNVDDNHVMKDIVYIGQSLPTFITNEPDKILQSRKQQHINKANTSSKVVGFMPMLKLHIFDWIILETEFDDNNKAGFIRLQEWANEREKFYIKLNGGILQDMNKRLLQTLNLTSGGQGDPKCIYESRMAVSNQHWNEFIAHLTEYNVKHKNININYLYICDDGYKLGQNIVSVRGGNMIGMAERSEILNNFEGWKWNIIEDKWEIFYDEMVKYKQEKGDCDVPQSYKTSEGYNLGQYLNKTRQGQFIAEFPERKKLLILLGVKWVILDERHDQTWISIEAYMQDYFDKYGHSNIPIKTIADNGFKIGHHVAHIRSRKDFTKDNPDRIKFLERVKFSWNVKVESEEDSWGEFYTHLIDYKDFKGHCNVPATYKCIDDDYALGSRCASIRQNNQYMNDQIKKQILEQIGFSWHPLLDKWLEFKNHIEEFYKTNNHCRVFDGHITDCGYRLGQTVITVRHGTYIDNYPERKLFLDKIGFIWSVHDKAWDDFIHHLEEYIKTYKNSEIVRSYVSPDDYKLGSRINNIKSRQQFIKGKPMRKQLLLDLGLIV